MPKPETIAWLQQSAALDGSATSRTLLEVLERLERLEAAKPLIKPIDDQQTLHSIALKMLDTLEQLNVLPEILDTLRRAISAPAPCPLAAPAATAPVPAGSLVERVRTAIVEHGDGETYIDEARAAIYEVAEWLRSERHSIAEADALMREADR